MEPLSLRSAAITDPSMRPILDWIDSYVSWEKLPEETRRDLAIRAHTGDTAAQAQMCNHNLRLVLSLACKRLGKGVPLNDLIQEGWIGLRAAAGKFDPARGNQFSTLATWWINRWLALAIIGQGRVIRLPHKASERLARIHMRLHVTGEPMRLDDQAWLDRLARRISGNKQLVNVSLDRIDTILAHLASLDKPIVSQHGGAEQKTTLGDMVAAPPLILTSESAHIGSVLVDLVNLKRMRARDAWMLIRFYGLDGQGEHSMPEISEELFAAERRAGVNPQRNKPMTREAVRQCIERARRQLRVYLQETQPSYFVSPSAHGTLKKQNKGLSGAPSAGQSESTESPQPKKRTSSDSSNRNSASHTAAPTPLRPHGNTKRGKGSRAAIPDGTRTSDTALGA